MTVLAILQARMSSSRLPGKVLLPILEQPMLALQIERIRRATTLDQIVVATSDSDADRPVAELCERLGVPCYRGSLYDVLDRFIGAARPYSPDWIVRLTGDCPLADPEVIDAVVREAVGDGRFDYVTNALEPTYPDGLDVEVVRYEVLEQAWREADRQSEREHVTAFVHRRPERFRIAHVRQERDLSHLRWTVDEPDDYALVVSIYERLYPDNPSFTTHDVLALLDVEPGLATLNTAHQRNEGYAKSLRMDQMTDFKARYASSEALLERALQTIPLGAQTFSKSVTQYPRGISPYFASRAAGSRLWDVDGNEYIDYINSLCSVTLGYSDPDVKAAVSAQLEDGVIFTLSSQLEMEVAEAIVEMVPCAEKVRFGKNGSDATAGAIRVARAFTGRDHVAVCGYHGWQDWYIGSTLRSRGVPQATRDLTHSFVYNDAKSLEVLLRERPDDYAAIILEPMNVQAPTPEFLSEVRALATRYGAVLVFDETITGFRFANGGAQELFGVTPDLATFGKGLANGYPVSAVAGRADIMQLMEEVFFSFTFGGEALSLAAAKATLRKLREQPVVETIVAQGDKVMQGVADLIARHECDAFLQISGHPSWSFLTISDAAPYSSWELKTLMMQELFARGILAYGTHNMSYAHSDEDIAALLGAYDAIFALFRQVIAEKSLDRVLMCKPLEPLFKVR